MAILHSRGVNGVYWPILSPGGKIVIFNDLNTLKQNGGRAQMIISQR